jgi:signal transduction histidine kinase
MPEPSSHPPGVTRAFASLSARLILLVLLMIAIVVGSLLLMKWQQGKALDQLIAVETRERAATLHKVVGHLQRELVAFTQKWAQRDDLVTFMTRAREPWIKTELLPAMSARHFNHVWILGVKDDLVFAGSPSGESPLPTAPTSLTEIMHRRPDEVSGVFSYPSAEGMMVVAYAMITPDPDREPAGLLLIGRTVTKESLQQLGEVLRGTVSLGSKTRQPSTHWLGITASMPLLGLGGAMVDSFVLNTPLPELTALVRQREDMKFLFITTFLVSGLVAFIFIYRLLLQPINLITSSLAKQTSGPIEVLLEREDEIGALAALVSDAFERKRELEQLLDRRAQLGRELHDGVIQTVYAAGLNLSGAAALCRQNPERAMEILEATRRELNQTIRELRSFIAELEPEDAREGPFGDSVRSIVQLLTASHRMEVALQIDAIAVESLGRTQRLQLLRIIREAVSNVVRHARATLLTVEFHRQGGEGKLLVRDNGDGFDPLRVERGHGLINLNARAADLGGRCEIESGVGQGTTLRLSFPIRSTEARTDK